ncbi:MAG: hypothetical protein Q3990_08815, partial [Desulfovibrionaceae bacterium]|nr:hypothetical protein [Desulfovibrionaceae bacterium]
MSRNLRTAGSCCLLLLSTFIAQNTAQAEDLVLRGTTYEGTTATVSGDAAELKSGEYDTVYGGRAAYTDDQSVTAAYASGTVVDMSKVSGISAASIYGGYADAQAWTNQTTSAIAGSYDVTSPLSGSATASNNIVVSTEGESTTIAGGYARVVPVFKCIYESVVADSEDISAADLDAITLTVRGGNGKAEANLNNVTSNGSVTTLYGGYAEAAYKDYNGNVYAGTTFADSAGNVHIMYKTATVTAIGGTNEAYASENTVTSNGGQADNAYGGYAKASNFVIAWSQGRQEAYANVTGGTTKASAKDNNVFFNGTSAGSVYGGYARAVTKARAGAYPYQTQDSVSIAIVKAGNAEALAESNHVQITGGQFTNVYGGRAETTEDTAMDGYTQEPVAGGESNASASSNTVTLTNAEVTQNLYGGYATGYALHTRPEADLEAQAHADGNTVALYGGSFTGGALYGGYSNLTGKFDAETSSISAKNNTLVLGTDTNGKSPVFGDSTVLYGGMTEASGITGDTSGNTLSFAGSSGMTAFNIKNFQNLTYQYAEMHAEEIILSLTDSDGTSLANADVSVSVVNLFGKDGSSAFLVGDKVILLQNANGGLLNTDSITTSAEITATTGIS